MSDICTAPAYPSEEEPFAWRRRLSRMGFGPTYRRAVPSACVERPHEYGLRFGRNVSVRSTFCCRNHHGLAQLGTRRRHATRCDTLRPNWVPPLAKAGQLVASARTTRAMQTVRSLWFHLTSHPRPTDKQALSWTHRNSCFPYAALQLATRRCNPPRRATPGCADCESGR